MIKDLSLFFQRSIFHLLLSLSLSTIYLFPSISFNSLSFSFQKSKIQKTLEASASFRATCNFDSEIFSSQYKSFSALRERKSEIVKK